MASAAVKDKAGVGQQRGWEIEAGETGLVFDIKRYAVHDGPGLRTAVFLKGCSLSCQWCHNPESINPRPEVVTFPQRCIGCGACFEVCPNQAHQKGQHGEHLLLRERCTACGACTEACYAEALVMAGRKMSVEEVVQVLQEDRPYYELSGGGITLSGGEPFVQPGFTRELLRACQEAGLHTAVDTSGHISWAIIEEALSYTDLVLYDLKHMDPAEHCKYTGATNDLALENLEKLSRTNVPIEIRIPVVPGVNDDPNLVVDMARFIDSLGNIVAVRLLAYHSLAGSKYASIGRPNRMPQVESPSRGHLAALAALMQPHLQVPIVYDL